jgi:predicted amidophosphoribosyltransferase
MAVLLYDFIDLVASKMVALVKRGAPRDFRDVFTVCTAGLTTPSDCWQWWRLRQSAAGSCANCCASGTACHRFPISANPWPIFVTIRFWIMYKEPCGD